MEIRHHTPEMAQGLLKRAREELRIKEHQEMLERYYKYMITQGFSWDSVYTNLSRALLFLKYSLLYVSRYNV